MTTWKDICYKLKMQGAIEGKARGGSDDSFASTYNSDIDTVTTNSSTPQINRSAYDSEWQMNYMIINRKDGL